MTNKARTLLLASGDILALILAFFIMLKIAIMRSGYVDIEMHVLPFSILSIFWLLIFYIFNLYELEISKPTIPHLKQTTTAFLATGIFSIIFFYGIPFFGITPKINLIVYIISSFILFLTWRRFFYHIFSSYFKKNIAFISGNRENDPYIKELVEYISTYPQSGYRVLGIHENLFEAIGEIKETTIVVVDKEILHNTNNFPMLYNKNWDVRNLIDTYENILYRVPINIIDEEWFIKNIKSERTDIYLDGKRLLDVASSVFILIVLFPLLAIIALLIKLTDGGPVFYKQNRVGQDGKIFKLCKFRSMRTDAEKDGPKWAEEKDSRVTFLGGILRKLHLDEIPQMWNVLKGDISFIGPRPERPEFVEQLEKEIPFYYLRHMIKPGFTGWAQIKFRYARNVMDSTTKFEYDLFYLKNRNIFIDAGILIRTIQIIFTH